MTLVEALRILFKHKIQIAVIFLTIATAATCAAFLTTPVYQSKASLLVKMLKQDTSRPGMGPDDANLPLNLSQDEVINTEIQILTDRELAEKVISTLQLAKLYPALAKKPKRDLAMEEAVLTFQKSLKAYGVRKSNVINIEFQHQDPKIAAKAVALLIDDFQAKHLALHSDPQSDFIGKELDALKEKLRVSEKNLQDYQQNNKVFSFDEQRTLLLSQRVEFDSSYKIAMNNVSELRKKVASLQSVKKVTYNNPNQYTPSDRDKIISDAQAKVLDLQLQEQELRRKYKESNRLVVDVRREKDMVSQFLKDQEHSIMNRVKTGSPVYQSIEMDLFRAQADLSAQTAKAGALRAQLAKLDSEIASLDTSEGKIKSLKRAVEIDEKNYKAYANKYEEARISGAMNMLKMSNISVIQSPTVPVKPIKPKKRMYVLCGLLLGMVSGVAYAYILENLAQTFSDPDTVEKYLGLPVLLTVSCKEVTKI